jgi:hypothetical protein
MTENARTTPGVDESCTVEKNKGPHNDDCDATVRQQGGQSQMTTAMAGADERPTLDGGPRKAADGESWSTNGC